MTAPWLLPLSTAEIAAVQRARITRGVTDFAGVIDTWDAIDEAVPPRGGRIAHDDLATRGCAAVAGPADDCSRPRARLCVDWGCRH